MHISCFTQPLSSIKICDAMALNSGCLRFSLFTDLESTLEVPAMKYKTTTHWVLSEGSCHVLCEAFHRPPGVNISPAKKKKQTNQAGWKYLHCKMLEMLFQVLINAFFVGAKKIIMQLQMLKYGTGSICSGQQHRRGVIFNNFKMSNSNPFWLRCRLRVSCDAFITFSLRRFQKGWKLRFYLQSPSKK